MAGEKQTVFERVLDACKVAVHSHIPVIYLLTDEISLVDKLVASDKLVARRAGVRLDGEVVRLVPLRDYEAYQRILDEKNGIRASNYIPTAVNCVEGDKCWDHMIRLDASAGASKKPDAISGIPMMGVIKNYNLYAKKVGEALAAKVLAGYVQTYVKAEPDSAIQKSVLLLAAPVLRLPEGLEQYVEVIDVYPPADFEIERIIQTFNAGRETLSKRYLGKLIENLRGFHESKIISLLNKVVTEADCLTNQACALARSGRGLPTALPRERQPETVALRMINEEKEQMLKKAGVLTWIRREPIHVGGLDRLVLWLEQKKGLLDDLNTAASEWSIQFPTGALVCGIPGSGKSLMAKKAAEILDIPLIKMDVGALLGKYTGESEQNMRNAQKMAEAMAPCVLWIDELEKAFAGVASGEGDSGTSRRMFASFLTWMQENRRPCFLFATANDVTSLPPEFLRRGRFDQKYFVYMPLRDECVEIFQAEMRKRFGDTPVNGAAVPAQLIDDADFWGEIVDFCVGEGRTKFLTGADITGLINDTLIGLYDAHRLSRSKAHMDREELRAQLQAQLLETQTYGETDLTSIAECFLSLCEKKFRPASGQVLFRYSDFDPDATPAIARERDSASGNYDDALYNTLRERINALHADRMEKKQLQRKLLQK